MGTWGTALFSNDLSCDIRSEYNTLLALGKENEDAERILFDYYSSMLGVGDDEEPMFWITLAYVEWKKGRLSELVKEKALYYIDSDIEINIWKRMANEKDVKERQKVLAKIRETIISPMPEKKKIRKPTVSKCPWEVGSLLAYRICTNKKIEDRACFGKYALLRVIMIKKHPLSKLTANELYNERMIVGLYGWLGDEIPDNTITNSLDFIPVKDFVRKTPVGIDLLDLIKDVNEEDKEVISSCMNNVFVHRVETCADLDWKSHNKTENVITYLGIDKRFQERIPDFFKTSITDYSLTTFLPFDVTLSNRLETYL